MLDPDGGNTLVDLLTFQKTMSKWIESCWMDRGVDDKAEEELFIKDLQTSIIDFQCGSQPDEYAGYSNRYMVEHPDLSIKIAEFNCTNKKLTDEKTKIQRSLDLAEETNSLLSEEISDLKSKLKSSQQAMQHVRTICNELEDTKILVKNLEDRISVVIAEKKHLEKDELLLRSQKQSLQDENDNLLSEKEKVTEKLDGLKVENSKLLHQLYEYENLLVQKDELLTQKMFQAEELMGQVEEQIALLQELKNEKNRLQEELLHTHEDKAIHSSLSHDECSSSLSLQSVHNEIEEMQKRQKAPDPFLELPDPFYHVFECSVGGEKIKEDIWTFTETELIHLRQEVDVLLNNLLQIMSSGHPATYLEEQSNIMKGLNCLTHLKCAWETYASKLSGAKTTNANKTLCLSQRTRLCTQWSLLPIKKELAVHHRLQQRGQSDMAAGEWITWLLAEGSCLLAPLMTKSYFSTWRLLLLLLCTLIFSIWPGENVWTVVSATLWPHLKLQHVKLPPI
ncbi:protein KASH5 isoform X2 [Eleutherodactylus coqui]